MASAGVHVSSGNRLFYNKRGIYTIIWESAYIAEIKRYTKLVIIPFLSGHLSHFNLYYIFDLGLM